MTDCKKKTVLVFYQHAVREMDACNRLMELLKTRAEVAATALFQIDFEWTAALRWAKKHGVDVILMPWLYHDDNYSLLGPFFDINPDLIPVNLHHEQVTSIMSEPVVLPVTSATRNGCFHFTWGEYFKNKLLSCGVDPRLIAVTGNMRFDLIDRSRDHGKKSDLATIYNLDEDKKWILFPESRGWVYETNDASLEEGVRQGVCREDYASLKDLELRSLDALYKQIEGLSSAFFSNYELIYRPHPGTHTPLSEHGGIRIIADRPIGEWLESADLVIAWGSTVAYEAEIAGVPFVRHEPIDNDVRFRPYGYENFPVIKSLSEINDELIISVGNKQKASPVYPEFYGESDGLSTARTADEVINLINNPPHLVIDFSLSGNQRKQLYRKVLYELFTHLSFITGFLQKTHWPRSAYRQIRDIPY